MVKIHVTILRGPHTVDALAELTELLQDQDVVLIENIMPQAYVGPWRKVLNLLSTNEQYIESFGQNLEKNLRDQFAARLAWSLRGANKLFDFVDVKLRSDDLEKESEQYSISYGFETVLARIAANPSERYELMNDFLQDRATMIQARDALVEKQVSFFINSTDKEPIKSSIATKGVCNIAVVVGFFHNIAVDLQKAHPGIAVSSVIYDEKNLASLRKNPIVDLIADKTTQADKFLSKKRIDYALIGILTYASLDLGSRQKESSASRRAAMISQGFSHELLKSTSSVYESIKPIELYADAELRAEVESLLKKVTK